ncbi:hypothetical protein F0U62_35000 [Cystobacter fuscus]|uniref:hypothetical protein n=1 Tax=Cystobacter fuscus TaxID=43 RepID=UPI002B2F4FF1|nr:hypothetical protein F0U62_35000 [Cystobacter fuscus]
MNFHVPPDRVPREGLCRIWYRPLPPDRQPAAMSCGHAHRTASRHGGLVIWASSPRSFQTGEVAATEYGPVSFDGVPPDRLPPPGSCRVWLDGMPPDRQPPPMSCPDASAYQRRHGGRVLFMPASDL